jgi:hypothetical protein
VAESEARQAKKTAQLVADVERRDREECQSHEHCAHTCPTSRNRLLMEGPALSRLR